MAFTLGCALSPNWAALLVFRFFTGSVASSPIAIVAGQLADVYNDPVARGRAFAWFMAVSDRNVLQFVMADVVQDDRLWAITSTDYLRMSELTESPDTSSNTNRV